MSQFKFTGTGVAIVTPFREDFSIDFKSLDKLIENLIAKGVDYLVALGTTGESSTLSKDEKKAVVNYVVDAVGKRVPIVVGIGGNNTQEVVDTIKEGNLDGVDAILSVSPYYNKPTQMGLYLHYKAIAAATTLPIILYNVPGRTGGNVSAETTLKLAGEFSNIVAVKEASGDMMQIMTLLKNRPKGFHVISGDDALTLPILALGGSGAISVVANAYPAEFSEMVRKGLACDLPKAIAIHNKLLDIIKALFSEGSPAGVKAALHAQGLVKNFVRLPLVPVSDAHYKTIAALIKGK